MAKKTNKKQNTQLFIESSKTVNEIISTSLSKQEIIYTKEKNNQNKTNKTKTNNQKTRFGFK